MRQCLCLFTDYGPFGPYVGLLHAKALSMGFDGPIVDLLHDAPAFRPYESGVVLNALFDGLPEEAVVVAVIDPGVGTARGGLILELGNRVVVGPDNGLLQALMERGAKAYRLPGIEEGHPKTFHGRDWFVPMAIRYLQGRLGRLPPVALTDCVSSPTREGGCIVYSDSFGNLMTDLDAAAMAQSNSVRLAGVTIAYADTFAKVERGQPFWYVNSVGLVELACNQASAAEHFQAGVGETVSIV